MLILSILFITLLILISHRWWRRAPIRRWYKALNLDRHYITFQQLYQDIDGFLLSRQARAKHDAIEYTYGEIDFISFSALLSLAHPDSNTIFYDLGSGTGKAVLTAAMVFNAQKSTGIELFNSLHHASLHQKQRLQQLPEYQAKASIIHFIHGDYLLADFSDATMIFIDATALFGETWRALNQHLQQMSVGTKVITTSKKLFSNAFVVKQTTTVKMSWGVVHAYIHQRTHEM